MLYRRLPHNELSREALRFGFRRSNQTGNLCQRLKDGTVATVFEDRLRRG
jgi:hypothetical protein